MREHCSVVDTFKLSFLKSNFLPLMGNEPVGYQNDARPGI